MWIRIRAVIIEDEPLAAQYRAELRPGALFLDIKLPGKDGVSLAANRVQRVLNSIDQPGSFALAS